MSAWYPNDDRDDRWYDTVPMPAAALDSAEGCAGDDNPGHGADRAPDWSGLLCAATVVIALASAVVLQMTGCWPACMRWLEALFTVAGGQP